MPPHRFGHWHLAGPVEEACWLPRRRRARPSAALDDGAMIAAAGPAVKMVWARMAGMGPVRFRADDFPPARLAEAKAARGAPFVSVCLPARNEAATVGDVVVAIGELGGTWGLVDEIVVVDDGSADGTCEVAAAAGALVVRAGDVLAECGPGTGKGEALWKALYAA